MVTAILLRASRLRRVVCVLGVCLLSVSCSTRAAAQAGAEAEPQRTERARRHYARALELYDAGARAEALHEFQSAYTLMGDPRLLFNIGQLELALQEPARARRSLEQYLREATGISEERRAAVRDQLGALAEDSTETEPRLGTIEAPRRPPAAHEPGAPRLATAAWISSGVLGLGALSTAVGTVLASRRHSELRSSRATAADAANARARLDRQRELVRELAIATDVLALAAIGSAGLGLYLTLSHGSEPARVSLEVGAGNIQVTGSF